MSGFNLLPEQFRRRRGAQFVPISIVVTIGIAVLGVLLMELATVSRAQQSSGSMLSNTLADRRRDLAMARATLEAVDAEVAVLSEVFPRSPVWSNLLIDVAGAVGPHVQLERWGSDADRGLCTIRGRAAGNREVFEFVAALEAMPHFASVTLAGVSRKEETDRRSGHEQGSDEVVFEIVCRLHHPAR